MAALLLISFLLIVIPSSIPISEGHKIPENFDDPYRHVETLDREGKYKLEWHVDWQSKRVFFNASVETRGFVVFGISKKDLNNIKLDQTDLIIAGVDWTGKPYISDRHSTGHHVPVEDTSQDWELHGGWENGRKTFLSFSRPFDTCDHQDLPINSDTTDLIWAYGETDNVAEYNFATARGSVSRYLLDPDLTPRVIREGKLVDPERQLKGSDIEVWSLKSELNIPPKRTTYWCHLHKLNLKRKHHIIGINFQINNETQPIMHHMLLFRCVLPNPSPIYDHFVHPDGEECSSLEKRLGQIPFDACAEIKAGHAIGGLGVFFPDAMGIPIGATGQSEYYLLQTHYDNPELRSDLRTVHSLDVYYTSQLRPNDGGVMSVGHHIPGSPSILLPPGTENHKIYGHCSGLCTKKLFPPQGIHVALALLHSHNGATRMAVQHFRGNRELPHIYKDDNWKLNFQPIKLLQKEVNILPGDQVSVRCHYDTTYTNRTTVGGPATNQEMCKTFLFYYSHLQNNFLSMCRSEIVSSEYTARYLGGARNLTYDQSLLELVANAPPHLKGMTVSEISDSRYVNWSEERRAKLKRDHIILPHADVCMNNEEFEKFLRTREGPKRTFVAFPLEAIEYRPPQECSLIK